MTLYVDLTVTKWGMSDGKMQRILKYWMPVSNPIGNIYINVFTFNTCL